MKVKTEHVEYPTIDQLTNMPSDSMYDYINATFCTGLANMLDNIKTYMIARYTMNDLNSAELSDDDPRLKPYFDNIAIIDSISQGTWSHTWYGEYAEDDIVITGECDDNYYAIWFDLDVSDCSIMKLSKQHFTDIEQFNDYVKEYFETELHYKIKPVRNPDGWFKW